MPTAKIRHNLARLRLHLGLSQAEVGPLVGVAYTTIRAIENLKLPLSVTLAEKLEAVFGAPKEWLFRPTAKALRETNS